jgi:hypothetical protein
VVKGFPEWLERVEVPKKDGTVHHPIANDARSLLWLAIKTASRFTSGHRERRISITQTSVFLISIL